MTKAGSQPVLTSGLNPSLFGQGVTLTAAGRPPPAGAGLATGTVTFKDEGPPPSGLSPPSPAGGLPASRSPSRAWPATSSPPSTPATPTSPASRPIPLTQVVTRAPTTLVASPAARFFPTFTVTLTRTFDGLPLAGQTVSITTDGKKKYSAVTDSKGQATFRPLGGDLPRRSRPTPPAFAGTATTCPSPPPGSSADTIDPAPGPLTARPAATPGPRPRRQIRRRDVARSGGDQQTRRSAASERPRAAAPRPRPDRPGVRAAAGRRGARPGRAHVGRASQPPVQARLRRVAVRLSDDAAHRAGDGAAAPGRPQRHRGLLRGRLLVARAPSAPASPSWSACRPASTGARRRGATAGMPPCVAKQVTRPIRNREAPAPTAQPSS